ncbi:hypothetical protein U1Q18_036413, partial [Sarracenia purpurea var. burkii]
TLIRFALGNIPTCFGARPAIPCSSLDTIFLVPSATTPSETILVVPDFKMPTGSCFSAAQARRSTGFCVLDIPSNTWRNGREYLTSCSKTLDPWSDFDFLTSSRKGSIIGFDFCSFNLHPGIDYLDYRSLINVKH